MEIIQWANKAGYEIRMTPEESLKLLNALKCAIEKGKGISFNHDLIIEFIVEES